MLGPDQIRDQRRDADAEIDHIARLQFRQRAAGDAHSRIIDIPAQRPHIA